MASKIKLEISMPCSENWDKMDKAEKGRFCRSCQKQVIDFTGMSEQQLALFFKRNKKNVCGRLTDEQLNNELTLPRKRIHWFRYFLQAALPAMIFSNRGYTQGKIALKQPVNWTQQYRDSLTKMKEVMHSASMDTIRKASAPAPDLGQVLAGRIGYISFRKVKKVKIRKAALKQTDEGKQTNEVLQCTKDSMTSSFKIFPNPVIAGTSLNIELISQLKEGYYNLEIVTIQGKLVFTKNDLWIDRGARVMNIAIPSLTQGSYALGLRNKKDGKVHSQLIIIKAE